MAKLALLGGERIIPEPVKKKNAGYFDAQTQFVKEFREYCGCKYARCFSWGTGALTASMVAAGVGPGDEVIVPSFTWPASVNCILHVNGIPVFADIDPKTFTLDVEDVKRKITRRTKAVVAVDIYGHPANIPALKKIAKPRGILVVEDSCQATGAEIRGKKVGTVADMTAFSFSGKPITSSSGGVFTTNNHCLYERALVAGEHTSLLSQLKNKELRERYAPTLGYGFKTRMDSHGAEGGLEQLRTLEKRNNARIKNCDFLTKAFSDIEGLTTPYVKPGYKHVYHLYTLLYEKQIFGVSRELFQKAIQAEGLRVVTYVNSANYMCFPGGRYVSAGPVHHRPVFQEKNLYGKGCPFKCPFGKEPDYSKGSLPVTERITDMELNIEQHNITLPKTRKTMQTYVDVFTKVIENIDELRKGTRRRKRS